MVSVVSFLLILVVACVSVRASLVPTHVYITLTGDPTQIQVTFTTTSKPSNASIIIWTEASSVQSVQMLIATDVHLFTRPVTSTINYINSVTLNGLKSGVYYNYQILGDSSDKSTKSQVFRFRHLPAANKPVSIGVYGDLGAYGYSLVQKGDHGLPKLAQTGKLDLIVHNGDLAYNLGSSNGQVGDAFMANLQQVASAVPYVVTPGNHEFKDSSDPIYYNNIWLGQDLLGRNSKSTNTRMWYSFDIGAAHVIGISTEVYCEDTDNIATQYAWLENDLKATRARKDSPWIIMFGHRPLYYGTNSYFHSRIMRQGLQCTDATLTNCNPLVPCASSKNCAYSIEALLEKYNVDLYTAAHKHTYVRNSPVSRNLTYEVHANKDVYHNPKHTIYVISGAAGTETDPPTISDSKSKSPEVVKDDTHGFSNIVVYNNTYVQFSQISTIDGALIDSFSIIKDNSKPTFTMQTFKLDSDDDKECDGQ